MSSKKMVKNEGLLTHINTSTGLRSRKDRVEQNICNTKTEQQFEIECERCYNTMALCSDFNGLYYFCEQCGFLLHTEKE